MKAIIFDCFGVLVGTGFWNVYQDLGGDPVADAEFIDSWINQVDLGQASSAALSQGMAEHLGVTVEEYNRAFAQDEIANEAVFAYIAAELKPKYRLGLVSNAMGDSVRRKIPADKLALFDEVLISGEVGLLKPDPRLFKMALERLDVAPHEALFVDDHQDYIDGAQAVGIKSILFTDLASLKKAIAKETT